MIANPLPAQPRVLAVTGTPHPKVEIQEVDTVNGRARFRWLDASGKPVDSGGGMARFTPSWSEAEGAREYIAPTDAELAAAIENPPAAPAAVVVLTPLQILGRLTPQEEAALATATDLAVQVVRNRLIAASEIRSDDPRTAEGRAILVAKGIVTEERAAEIFA
jgi:hypothetical protein